MRKSFFALLSWRRRTLPLAALTRPRLIRLFNVLAVLRAPPLQGTPKSSVDLTGGTESPHWEKREESATTAALGVPITTDLSAMINPLARESAQNRMPDWRAVRMVSSVLLPTVS